MVNIEEYKGYKLKQDNGGGVFAVIPTYSVYDPDDEEKKLAARMRLSDAKLFIDAHSNN